MSITYEQYNTQLRLPEQEKDEQLLLKNKHHALCYAPGKGKSMPVIHCIKKVNELKGGKAKVLIMSDATCIKDMWKAEIIPMHVLPKETYMVTDRTAIGKVKEALLKTKWDVIVVDECQSLRSGVTRAKSQFAKLVFQLTKNTEYVWGMTGTISGNNNIEPFCVLHALHIGGLGNINCHAFKNTYCIKELQYGPFGAFEKPVKLNTAGEKLMTGVYQQCCSFWDYDDNDNMPELDIKVETFTVPATDTYQKALDGILQCGENESTVLKAIALQKAQQALNGFLYYDLDAERKTFEVPEFENPKIKYVVDRCKQEVCIIAYRFQEDAYYIAKGLDEAGIKHCEKISEFKERAERGEHIILILQCSRGKAVNLQFCQHIIYYTADHSFIYYKQMIHRCWRRGQQEKCSITFLVNDPGDKYKVERKLWDGLQHKQNIHDTLMQIKNT